MIFLIPVWLDLVKANDKVPTFEGNVIVKVARVGRATGRESGQEQFPDTRQVS